MTDRRNYRQACGIARALDLLGERWTLLIIRDLLVGPRRYSDLLDGLPGIGTNILASRLRLLEAEGLVFKRALPQPAESVTVYDLTEAGKALEPVLHALVRWSWRHLGTPSEGQRQDPRWTVLALRAAFDPEEAGGLDATYAFELSGQPISVRVRGGAIETTLGPAADPDVTLRTDDRTLARIRAGALTLDEARKTGALTIEGAAPAVERMFRVLSRR